MNDKVRKQKLASEDPKRIKLEQDAADDECALLREPIDLPLPDSNQSVEAGKRGSHKCAHEPTPTQKTAGAQEALLAAEKAVELAQIELDKAGAKEGVKQAAFDRALAAFKARSGKIRGLVLIDSLETREHAADAAHVAWMQAGAVVQSAENSLLRAMLAESDAHHELLYLRFQEGSEREANLIAMNSELATLAPGAICTASPSNRIMLVNVLHNCCAHML